MVGPAAASRPARLPRQVITVAAGLAVLGLTSLGYLAVVSRQLGPADVVPLATLWVLINAIGPGLFFPLEQEVGRAVAARRVVDLGARPILVRAALLGLGLLAALAVVCLVAAGALSEALFDGQGLVLAALVLASGGLALEHLTRGAYAGNGQFLRYGAQLGVDGALRLTGAVVLVAAGSSRIGLYAVLLAAAPVLAVLVTAPRPTRLTGPGPPASWSDLGGALGLLLGGSVFAQVLVNAPPIAVTLLAAPADRDRAGVFITALVFARIPLFVFAAVQAVLLPGLAALAALGDRGGYLRRLTRILVVVGALGAGGLVVIAAIGPWLVELIFGAEFVTTRPALIPLAAAATAYMVALVLSQALISLRSYRGSLVGWVCGSAVFLLALLNPAGLEARVGLAFLAGTVAGALALSLALRARLRHPALLAGAR